MCILLNKFQLLIVLYTTPLLFFYHLFSGYIFHYFSMFFSSSSLPLLHPRTTRYCILYSYSCDNNYTKRILNVCIFAYFPFFSLFFFIVVVVVIVVFTWMIVNKVKTNTNRKKKQFQYNMNAKHLLHEFLILYYAAIVRDKNRGKSKKKSLFFFSLKY